MALQATVLFFALEGLLWLFLRVPRPSVYRGVLLANGTLAFALAILLFCVAVGHLTYGHAVPPFAPAICVAMSVPLLAASVALAILRRKLLVRRP